MVDGDVLLEERRWRMNLYGFLRQDVLDQVDLLQREDGGGHTDKAQDKGDLREEKFEEKKNVEK